MKRKIIRYIIMVIVITLLFFGVSVSDRFIRIYQKNNMGSEYVFIFQFIFYCIAGTIFGVEKILCERNKIGRWKINLPRFIIVGLPSFLIGSFIILIFKFTFILNFLSLSFVNFSLFVSFMQMFFGYIIVTSFYKAEEIPLSNK